MWVKGMPLHFVVDNGSQKNLISVEVVKILELPTTPHPQPYKIGWLSQGRDIRITQQCLLPYGYYSLFYFHHLIEYVFIVSLLSLQNFYDYDYVYVLSFRSPINLDQLISSQVFLS